MPGELSADTRQRASDLTAISPEARSPPSRLVTTGLKGHPVRHLGSTDQLQGPLAYPDLRIRPARRAMRRPFWLVGISLKARWRALLADRDQTEGARNGPLGWSGSGRRRVGGPSTWSVVKRRAGRRRAALGSALCCRAHACWRAGRGRRRGACRRPRPGRGYPRGHRARCRGSG